VQMSLNENSDESWRRQLSSPLYGGLFERCPDALGKIRTIVNDMKTIGWKGPADFDRFVKSYGYGPTEVPMIVNEWKTREFRWMGILGKYKSRGAFLDYDDHQPRTGPEQLPPYYNSVSNLPFLRTIFERVYALYENAWTKFVGRETYTEFKQHFKTVRIRFSRIEAVVGAYATPKPTLTISEESTVSTNFWGGLGMELPHDPQNRSMFMSQAYVLAGMEVIMRRILDLHKSYLQIVVMQRPDPYQKYLIEDYSSLNKSLPALLEEWVHIWMGIFNRNRDVPLEALMSRLRTHVSTYNPSHRYAADTQKYGIIVSRPLIEAIRANERNREYWIVGRDRTGLRGQFADTQKDSYEVRNTVILPMDKHWGQDDPDGSYLLQSNKEEYQAYFFPHPDDYLREGEPYPGGRSNFCMYDCQQRGWRLVTLDDWLRAQTFDPPQSIQERMTMLSTHDEPASWDKWNQNMFRVLSESVALRIGGRNWNWDLAVDTLRQAFKAGRLVIEMRGADDNTHGDKEFGYMDKKLNDRSDQVAERIVLEACGRYDDFMGQMFNKTQLRGGDFDDTQLFKVLCNMEGGDDLTLISRGEITEDSLRHQTFIEPLKRAIRKSGVMGLDDQSRIIFNKHLYDVANDLQIPRIEAQIGTSRDIRSIYGTFNRNHIPLPEGPVAIAPSVSLTESAIFSAKGAIIMSAGPFEIMPIKTIDKKHYVEVERNMGVRFDDPKDVLFMRDVFYDRALDHQAPQSKFMTVESLSQGNLAPRFMPRGELIAFSCGYGSELSKETVFPIEGKLPDHHTEMNQHRDASRQYFNPNGMLAKYIENVCRMRQNNAPNSKADYFRHKDVSPVRSSIFVYKGEQYSKVNGRQIYRQAGTGPLRHVFDASYTI